MPGYSSKAQPFLDAIAEAVFASTTCRDWLIKGTSAEASYLGSDVLIDEQRQVRWRRKQTTQPFWANYWCGRDSRCTCRGNGTGIESDAIFFLRNSASRVLAVHVEFKHPAETFGLGQTEAYPRRAACFVETFASRATVNPHHDWTTVIFCDEKTATDPRAAHFQRVITHSEAGKIINGYPPTATQGADAK